MAALANLFIVENHHEVLLHWAAFRQKLPEAPRLITLDHHTDTSSPFRHYLNHLSGGHFLQEQKKRLEGISYDEPESIKCALQYLAHDEHIVTALKKDILSSAWVIAHNARDTDLQTYQQHQIVCYSVGRDSTRSAATREECDRVLESKFLEEALVYFQKIHQQSQDEPFAVRPYILDLDMDAFNTRKSLNPDNDEVFARLIQGAGLITVAMEPRHFVMCSLENDYTAEMAFADLQQRFFKK